MADYEFQFRLTRAPESRIDGTGMVGHDIWVLAREEGSADEWQTTPRHKTVLVPGADLSAALATGTTGQKVTAYKNLLRTNVNTQADPVTGWDDVSLEAMMDGNDASAAAAVAANEFITVTLNKTYPVDFPL